MTQRALDRRTFVRTTAALGAATALAGCSGGGDGGDGSDGSDGSDGGDGSAGSDSGSGGQEFLSEEPDYGGFLDGANNYEQTLDMTGSDSVTVDVGAGEGLAFGPAAVAVSSGTTVTWEWTGEGGQHNVSGSDGDFESDTVGEEGHTFEHTFEESGTYTYVCTPHEAVGMKGAIYVD
jgi:halocyanin-like protein